MSLFKNIKKFLTVMVFKIHAITFFLFSRKSLIPLRKEIRTESRPFRSCLFLPFLFVLSFLLFLPFQFIRTSMHPQALVLRPCTLVLLQRPHLSKLQEKGLQASKKSSLHYLLQPYRLPPSFEDQMKQRIPE
jgi:hypothetical protein